MNSVRSTDMPRMLRSSSSARPTPITISTLTTDDRKAQRDAQAFAEGGVVERVT
jgi:hypothetical protein